jgi:predicted kinase
MAADSSPSAPDPALILVTGKPASGKSTLATKLAADLQYPLLTKDSIKEALYDSLGWSNKEHSRRLGIASFNVLYVVLGALLSAGVSAVAEAPFHPEISARELTALRDRHPFTLVQVLCRAEGQVLIERYRSRNLSGERHPGHVQTDAMADVEAYLANGEYAPVAMDSTIIKVDTTNPAEMDYTKLMEDIRRAMGPG